MEDMLRLNFFILAGLLALGAVWWVVEHAVGALRPAPPASEPAQPQHAPRALAQPRAPLAQPSRAVRDLAPAQRQHTIIAARPGDGKTTAQVAMLTADLARGAQVVVCNPQFTYYHPDDQPTDLRGLRDAFEVVRDEADIARTMAEVYAIGKSREPLYLDGQHVGHDIVLYLDEWPRIVDSPAGDAAAAHLRKIVRELRKCNVWVVLASQDAQVETLGFKSGLRSAFTTKLVGNVDAATWRALVGSAPQQPMRRGEWMTDRGVLSVALPTPADVAAAARGAQAHAALSVTAMDSADSAIAGAIPPDSAPQLNSIAWEDEVVRLAAEGQSTREILAALGGNYNRIVELAREGRALVGR